MIVKDDRGKAIAWQIVSDNMTCYHFSDKKKKKKQFKSSVCILYTVCSLHFLPILHFVPGLQSAFCTRFAVCILYWPAIGMFFEGNDISVSLPTGYVKSLIHQAAPAIDRLSPLEETGHYNFCAAN